jgi:O-antigen/teichoic acid export membrane protein
MAFSFCTGLFISGIAGAGLFGTISVFTVNAALMVLLSGMGHDASLYWHRSSGALDSSKSMGYGWLISVQQLVLFTVVSIISLFLTDKLLLSRKSIGFLPLEAAYFTGLIITERYFTFYYSSGKAAVCNKVLAWISAITFLIPALLYFFVPQYLPGALTLFCLIPFCHGIILAIVFHAGKHHPGFSFPDKSGLKSIMRFSMLVFITNLIQFLAYRVDYWMIGYFTGDDAQVGLYAQSSRFAQLFWVVPNIVAAIIYHNLSSGDRETGKEDVKRLSRVMNFLNVIIIPFLVLSAYLIISLFLPDYRESYPVFLLLIPGMFLFCNSILLASFFSANRELHINFYLSGLCFLVILILDFLLIPSFGITGAAWANTAAYGFAGITAMIVFCVREKTGIFQLLLPAKDDFRMISKIFSKE